MASPDTRSVDLAIEQFGGKVSQFDAQKLPSGASPFNQDVTFSTAGGVGSRPGLQNVYPGFAGNPTVNYIRTFVDTLEALRQMSLDGAGNVRQDFPQNTLTIVGTVVAGAFAQSDTYAGREWMAIGDGQFGLDIPRQWDGTNFDRVSQCGPGAGPVVTNYLPAAATIAGPGGGAGIAINPSAAGIIWGGFVQLNPYYPQFGPNTPGFTFFTVNAPGINVNPGDVVTIAGSASTPSVNSNWTVASGGVNSFTVNQTVAQSGAANGGGGTVKGPTQLTNSVVRQNNIATASTSAAHGFQKGETVNVSAVGVVAVGGGISAISQQFGQVTVATASAHGLVPGSLAVIAGTTNYNGTFTVLTVADTTHFTFQITGTPASEAAGTVSTTFNGTFAILTVPSATSFTYGNLGPNVSTTSGGAATVVGNVSAGLHQAAVCFLTREGCITVPSIPVSFYANGAQLLSLTQIAIGPANIVARIVIFTPVITAPAVTGPFFYFGSNTQASTASFPSMIIGDNTTTSMVFDFLDAVLQNATPATLYFNRLELGECSATLSYSERTFWAGERNKVNSSGGGGGFNNLTFDGGFSGNTPLGWTLDTTGLGTGGAQENVKTVWGFAYKITGDGATATTGKVTQAAGVDYLGVPIIQTQAGFSVRVRVARNVALLQGTLHIQLTSVLLGGAIAPGLAVTAAQATLSYVEFTAVLTGPLVSVPSDLTLNLFADGTLTNTGSFYVDNIEIFPTQQSINRTIVRVSYSGNPEGFDSLTGFLVVGKDNGQAVRTFFRLLDNKLYFVKERSLYVTSDDNQNEPALWPVTTVSDTVGTLSMHGVGVGEAWAVIAHHDGLYIFWGADPVKISQEIQPDWDTINWAAGQNIYVTVDTQRKRIHVGVPTGVSTVPNQEFVLDYSQLNNAQEIADHPQAYYSQFAPGKVIAPGRARKWTIWNLLGGAGANCAAMTLRADGSYHLLRGNASGTGKIYDQVTTQFSDDGIVINSQYQTYFFPETEQEQMLQLGAQRKLFKYQTGYAWGSGTMFFTVTGPQGQRQKSLSNLTLRNPDHWDFNMNVNWVGERGSLIFGTGAVGSWFNLTKLCPVVQRELFIPVRSNA